MTETISDATTVEVGGSRKPPGRKTHPERGDLRFGRSCVTNAEECTCRQTPVMSHGSPVQGHLSP